MNTEVFRNFLKSIEGISSCTLTFDGEGDPLRHPQFDDFVTMAKQAGIKAIHVRTNLQADSEVIDRLIACEPSIISVDLDADNAETHQRIHGNGQWAQVIANLERIFSERRVIEGQGWGAFALPWIVPRLRRCEDNLGDQASFFERWRRQLGTALVEGDIKAITSNDQGLSQTWPPEKYIAEQSMRIMMVMADGTIPISGAGSDVIGAVGDVDSSRIWKRLVEARRRLRHERGVGPRDLSMIRW